MMKYLVNHTEDFSAPFNAFLVGFLQVFTGLMTEMACICFLGSVNAEIDVIIKYMALSSIAKVDDFYAGALPGDNRIKGKSDALIVVNHRRGIAERKEKFGYGCKFMIGRFFFKCSRIFYASYVFYFFPYTTLMLPWISAFIRQINGSGI